jgi:hypothetical protein
VSNLSKGSLGSRTIREHPMKARTFTTAAATVAFAPMITFVSAHRAEAHYGWSWGALVRTWQQLILYAAQE